MRMRLKSYTLLLIVMLMLASAETSAQEIKPNKSGLAPVNGIEMYYEIYGEGDPLILLHGSFYTIGMNWSELIPELAKTRKVVALEFQGHGHSPYSDREFSISNLAWDVEKLLDYLNIDSADVAGYSMGGSVAYQFAVQSPERLRKLVIISSVYKDAGWLSIGNDAFEDFKPEFFDNTPLQTGYEAVAPVKTDWRKFTTQMVEFMKVPLDIGDSNIAGITAPVLIIAGDNDGTDKIELMKTYQLFGGSVMADMEPMPKSQLAILPSQSHVSVMMETKAILTYMESFLQ